jgi:predicted nuclease of predicted toxin-antitoxin system
MKSTLLLDHDLEGFEVFLQAGLRETGWDQIFSLEFKRLREFGLPENYTDQEVWRFAQQHGLLLVTKQS